jgi:hypothetical protein
MEMKSGVVVNMGSALYMSPSSLVPETWASGPEGCAAGAPNVPDREGVLEGGARPPMH